MPRPLRYNRPMTNIGPFKARGPRAYLREAMEQRGLDTEQKCLDLAWLEAVKRHKA